MDAGCLRDVRKQCACRRRSSPGATAGSVLAHCAPTSQCIALQALTVHADLAAERMSCGELGGPLLVSSLIRVAVPWQLCAPAPAWLACSVMLIQHLEKHARLFSRAQGAPCDG